MKLNELRKIINEELMSVVEKKLSGEQKEKIRTVLTGMSMHTNTIIDNLDIEDMTVDQITIFIDIVKRRLDKLSAITSGLNAR
jgi:hypothetical protein